MYLNIKKDPKWDIIWPSFLTFIIYVVENQIKYLEIKKLPSQMKSYKMEQVSEFDLWCHGLLLQ